MQSTANYSNQNIHARLSSLLKTGDTTCRNRTIQDSSARKIRRIFARKYATPAYLVLAILLSFVLSGAVLANPRHAAIVIDAGTGAVLHESNADASRYPASLTKMMTLYMLFEAIEQRKIALDTRMPVSAHAAAMPQTNIGLRTGDSISVREAIPALIVRSANDVAAVVAEMLGNSETNFSHMMTSKARKLGMRSTTFRNASGLPNNEQKTTARDMATLSTRLIKDFPGYYHYFSTQSFSYKGVTYNSHNRMVRNTQGVDGLKTGFIRASGFNVATSAQRDNRRVIAVVMGGHTAAARDQHMAQLLNRSFNQNTSTARVTTNTTNTRIRTDIARTDIPKPILKPSSQLTSERISDPVTIQQVAYPEAHMLAHKAAPLQEDSWAVQIGSYHALDRAHAHAQEAARWIPGEVAVTEVEISNRKLYRARLIGLQENQARSACQNLSRQGIECLVIRS